MSEEAFKSEPLSGVGEGPWRVMWQAARDYSSKAAYREQHFPVVAAEDALCVLCQQVLGAEARDRLSRFRDFMEGEVARLAEEAEAAFAQAQQEFDAINIDRSDDDVALLEEIKPEDKDLAQAVTGFFDTGTRRKEGLVQLEEVLSEGEHRAVALSCFLAEAKQLLGQPPLVIDDPRLIAGPHKT